MSQNDFIIANQSAPDFRSDLNNALQALASLSSGATAPSTTYANMLWYDTANNILKMRTEADDAWIDIGTLNQSTNTFEVAGKVLPEATWEAGTSTDEAIVSPAKIKAAIDVLAPPQSPRLISTTTITDDERNVTITGLGGYRHIMAWTDANLTSGAVRELVVGSAGGFVTSGYICEDASYRSSIRLHSNNTANNQSGLVIIYNFNTTDAVKPVINAINRSDKVTAIGSATAFDRIRFELSDVLSDYVTGSRFLVWGWN